MSITGHDFLGNYVVSKYLFVNHGPYVHLSRRESHVCWCDYECLDYP